VDVSSYGVDPAFKPETASFQADLVAADDGPMLAVYDCDKLVSGRPTYNVLEPATGLTVNPKPYCAQLFNPRFKWEIDWAEQCRSLSTALIQGFADCFRQRECQALAEQSLSDQQCRFSRSLSPLRNVPYGFHHFPLSGAPPGFPVWLDINLSQAGAATWLAWLRDALLPDDATRGLTARMVTYNADLGVFASVRVDFDFGAGGSIQVRQKVMLQGKSQADQASTNIAKACNKEGSHPSGSVACTPGGYM
jgi:hypothetical protein